MEHKKFVIFGGTGFIGRRLVEALNPEYAEIIVVTTS